MVNKFENIFLTSVGVTDVSMTIAVAGDTGGKWTPIRWVMAGPWSTGLTKLTHISSWTRAHFYPRGMSSRCSSAGCVKLHIIQKPNSYRHNVIVYINQDTMINSERLSVILYKISYA